MGKIIKVTTEVDGKHDDIVAYLTIEDDWSESKIEEEAKALAFEDISWSYKEVESEDESTEYRLGEVLLGR